MGFEFEKLAECSISFSQAVHLNFYACSYDKIGVQWI